MILFLSICFLCVRSSASAEVPLMGWYSPPKTRGTWDIIVSCVLTLTICVWSALHLNVPTEDSTFMQKNVRCARWILMGIFAPELVVSTAFAQFLTARWLCNEIRKDVQFRKEYGTNPAWSSEQQLQEWSLIQCYFSVMGGLRVETPDCIAGNPRLSLTAEGVRLLSFLGRLPELDENQIRDKSKADGLAKFLVVLQAGWMIIQTLARVQQNLPVTLLEINTMGHVICAFALYALWWSKPLGIKDPTLIRHEPWMDKFIATFYMCSPICWHNDDFISEIRCMIYVPPAERGIQDTAASPNIVPLNKKSRAQTLSKISNKPQKTKLSVGSIGAIDPIKFIGPLESFQVAEELGETKDHGVTYVVPAQSFKVAPEHEIFFELEKPSHGLRHSRVYCRRALKDCQTHDELPHCALERWRLTNELVDDLWAECETRQKYRDYFFTMSSLGIWVGEQIYISDYVPNFSGLYLGSVNVHRDSLKSVLAFAGSAYGGLHLSAWNDFFPTQVERWLWCSSAIATGAFGVLLALFFLATQKIRAFEQIEHFIRNHKVVRWSITGLVTPLFAVARVFIVVEAFISLRWQPSTVYSLPEWSNYFPHL